jgi:hypothetical protein
MGLVLWQRAGVERSRTVLIRLARIADFGLNEHAARRAVRHLRRAGLIETQAEPGRGLLVTLLDAPDGPEGEGPDSGDSPG